MARNVGNQLADSLGPDVIVRDWTRTNRNWFDAVQVEKRMMFIILTLIVAVAAFNLVSTLVMTVTPPLGRPLTPGDATRTGSSRRCRCPGCSAG